MKRASHALWLALFGCGPSAPPQTTPAPVVPTAASPVTVAVPVANQVETCESITARYVEASHHRVDTCARDSDCVHYGGIDPENVCGGVTNTETAQTLTRIRNELNEAGCPRRGFSCIEQDPRCVEGTCR